MQGLVYTLIKLLICHAVKTQSCRIPEIFLHSKLLDEQVILRHEAYESLSFLFTDRMPVDSDAPGLGNDVAVEQVQQGSLARAAPAHYRQQRAAFQSEREVMYAIIRVGETEVDITGCKADTLSFA